MPRRKASQKNPSRYQTVSVPSKKKDIEEIPALVSNVEVEVEVDPNTYFTSEVIMLSEPIKNDTLSVIYAYNGGFSSTTTTRFKTEYLGESVADAYSYDHEYFSKGGKTTESFLGSSNIKVLTEGVIGMTNNGFVHSRKDGSISRKHVGDRQMYSYRFIISCDTSKINHDRVYWSLQINDLYIVLVNYNK